MIGFRGVRTNPRAKTHISSFCQVVKRTCGAKTIVYCLTLSCVNKIILLNANAKGIAIRQMFAYEYDEFCFGLE